LSLTGGRSGMAIYHCSGWLISPGLIHTASGLAAKSTLVLAAALALGGCRPPSPREGAASEVAQVADTLLERSSMPVTMQGLPRDSILQLLDDYGRSFGDERATVISRLGTPTRVTTRLIKGIDTLFLLQYPTASLSVRVWTAEQVEELDEIRVWGPLPGLPPVISLGVTTRPQLLAMLGNPDYRSSEVLVDTIPLVYDLGDPDFTVLLTLYVVGDTVRVLKWQFRMG